MGSGYGQNSVQGLQGEVDLGMAGQEGGDGRWSWCQPPSCARECAKASPREHRRPLPGPPAAQSHGLSWSTVHFGEQTWHRDPLAPSPRSWALSRAVWRQIQGQWWLPATMDRGGGADAGKVSRAAVHLAQAPAALWSVTWRRAERPGTRRTEQKRGKKQTTTTRGCNRQEGLGGRPGPDL